MDRSDSEKEDNEPPECHHHANTERVPAASPMDPVNSLNFETMMQNPLGVEN